MAWIYALSLLILGFVLILLEIFVIPGFNIFGIIGFLTVCAGIGHAYINMGFWQAATVAALGLVGTAVLVRMMIRARAWERLVLESATSRERGYDSATPEREALMGQQGEALTPLRPAGRAQFGEQAFDVVSEGGFISRGERVEVMQVAGNRVVVFRIPDETPDASVIPSTDDLESDSNE
ncbi:MAG: hypothetical protein HOC74_06380 [Gemmatimonadetes bacterium]|jgi:membrane-bound serine protease (ClpP class)|nr:hypothetical protein [Gemmatimonadota bacterium]